MKTRMRSDAQHQRHMHVAMNVTGDWRLEFTRPVFSTCSLHLPCAVEKHVLPAHRGKRAMYGARSEKLLGGSLAVRNHHCCGRDEDDFRRSCLSVSPLCLFLQVSQLNDCCRASRVCETSFNSPVSDPPPDVISLG